MGAPDGNYDFDWLIVGSGFGGSVSALRLSEKGYSVGVLECGRRFADQDFPSTTSDLKRYFWSPRLGMKGIFRLTTFKDVSVVSGCGVGGGSLGYACTLYVPPKGSSRTASGRTWRTGRARSPPTTTRRSGCSAYPEPARGSADQMLRELGEELGVGDSYKRTPVGIYFGESGKTVSDPFFGGEGPGNPGPAATSCGQCMVGCRHGAKNMLVEELPLVRREARRARHARNGWSWTSARSAPRTAAKATRSKACARARG